MKKFYTFTLSFFGLFLFSQSPGGVSGNLKLWLKAEDYTLLPTPIWSDSSPASLDFVVDGALLTPGRTENFTNFNPAASF